MRETITDDGCERNRVEDWLLAILRFAVTLQEADKTAVLAMAHNMDRLSSHREPATFTFFVSTTTEFCNAISDRDYPERIGIIRRQLGRVDDARLRQAIEGAMGLAEAPATPTSPGRRRRADLWKGLRPK